MKPTFLVVLLASVALLCSSRFAVAAEPPKFVPVASYANSAEMRETVGHRVHAILRTEKIQSVAVGSAGMTVSVPAHQVAEALQVLARAVKAEKLQLTLLGPNGILTPDEILKGRNAE